MRATRIALLPFVVLGIAAAREDRMKSWDFQSDKVDEAPAGFSFGDRFPVAVADAPVLRDVRLEVRCKPVSGKVDQACGLVFRYRDENNYYLTRANALEDNVRLYHVANGRRRQLAGWNGKVAGQTWHTLAVVARGNRFQVHFDGNPVIDAQDDTFKEAGKVGVWTKADSVTHFDALSATPLE